MVERPNTIWRDFATDGVSSSGAHKPRKSQIRAWGEYIQAFLNGGNFLGYTTKAAMDADLAHAAGSLAIVYGESATNDGLYLKSGASGAGSWAKIGNVPGYSFETATDGGGTANAIVATTIGGVDSTRLIALPIEITNTATPVTVAFNGDSALTIKTAAGNNPAVGGLVAGTIVLGYGDPPNFRLLSDQASAAIQAAAEAAQAAAETAQAAAEAARDLAQDYASNAVDASGLLPRYASVASLLADTDIYYSGGTGIYEVSTGVKIWAGEFLYEVAASGASDHHVTTAGGVKLKVSPAGDGSLPLAAFGTLDAAGLTAAIEVADTLGLVLDWADLEIEIETAVTATVDRVRWRSNGAKVTYTGAGDIVNPFQINIGDGVDHKIFGSGLEFDGDGKCHIGPRFTQALGTQTATFYAERLIVRNIEMQVGAGVGASGIQIRGGFGRVVLVEPEAHELMMRTGAGTPGSSGIIGILVINQPSVTDAYCRHLEIIRPKVTHVYSEDAAYDDDMDGIGVFANPDVDGENSYAKIVEPDCKDCWGRDVKTQFARAEIINPQSVLSEAPTGGKIYPFYDFQSGPGTLRGGNVTIDGVDATDVIRYGTSTAVGDCVHMVEGITVSLINSGTLIRVASQANTPLVKMVTKTKAVTILGTVQELIQVSTGGLELDFAYVEDCVGTFSDALIRVIAAGGASPRVARVFARGCINLGTAVGTLRQNVSGSAAQALLSQEDCYGFTDPPKKEGLNDGTFSGGLINGIIRPERLDFATTPFNHYEVAGMRLVGFGLTNNGEVLLPEHGHESGTIILIRASQASANAYAMISFSPSAIVNISVGAGFNVGTTSDPGAGDYRVWRDGNQLRVKNAQGSFRYFTVWMVG